MAASEIIMNSPGRRPGAPPPHRAAPRAAATSAAAARQGIVGSARGSSAGAPSSPGSSKRTAASASPLQRAPSSPGSIGRGYASDGDGANSAALSRVSSYGGLSKDRKQAEPAQPAQEPSVGLFLIIQQLAAAENALWNILDGLKSNTTHVSFFCREYWGCSCSQAQLSLDRLNCHERLKRQVQQACVLESLSLGVAAHLCSGVMHGVSVTIRSRLRNLLYYIHENCLVLLDMVCQRWMVENQNHWQESSKSGHCPENLNLDILVRVKRYRRLRRGEHVMALRQHNEMIINVVRQLCRGVAPKRPPLSSRGGALSPGVRSPGTRTDAGNAVQSSANALSVVNDVLTARMPLDRLRASTIRSKMLQYLCFKPLLKVDGSDPDCPWPVEDPFPRYGADTFAQDGPIIWFEPLPPMLPNFGENPKLPPVSSPDVYTLVLDLDETLVHYFECDGMGNYDIRPGMHDFLERMSHLGYEIVIFTAATQDYADWVIDQIDPGRLIHYRLYRQHALPWGPVFVKDLSFLGRDLDRTLIIDNVQENFMLQPHNGIFIVTWYDDPQDTALFALGPLLDELVATKAKVPEILDRYRDQIPTWAGFDQYSQLGGDYSEFDLGDDGYLPGEPGGLKAAPPQPPQLPPAPAAPQPQVYQQPQAAVKMDQLAAEEYLRPQARSQLQVAQRLATPVDVGIGGAAAAVSATSPYAGRYSAAAGHTAYLQRPQGGYPVTTATLHAQAQAPQEAPRQEQARAAPQSQVVGTAPGVAPQRPQAHGMTTYQVQAPVPAFSASGIAGPCQAPMPSSHAAMCGQRGVGSYAGGPLQAPRR